MRQQLFTNKVVIRTSILAIVLFVAEIIWSITNDSFSYINALLLSLFGIILGLGCVYGLWRKFGYDNMADWPEYYRQPPTADTPMFWVKHLVDQNPGYQSGERNFNKDLVITFLSLSYKQAYAYRVLPGGDLYFEKQKREGLIFTDFETATIDLFDLLVGNGVHLSQLHNRARAIMEGDDPSDLRRKYSSAEMLLQVEYGQQPRSWLSQTGALVWAVGAIVIFAMYISNMKGDSSIWLSLGLTVGYSATSTSAVTGIKPGKNKELGEWIGFRNYVKDFPRFDQSDIDSLKLWDELLIYAIVFGYATTINKQDIFKLPAGISAIRLTNEEASEQRAASVGIIMSKLSIGFGHQKDA